MEDGEPQPIGVSHNQLGQANTCSNGRDGGPQQIGPSSDTILEMGLRPNSTQKLAQE